MKTFLQKLFALAGTFLLATAAPAQNFAVDSFTLDSGGGTSTGGVFAVSGTIGRPEADPMSGRIFSLKGEFLSLMPTATVAPPAVPITIFDNTPGEESGGFGATTNIWLAGKFCLGSQSYRLDSLSLLLSSGNFVGNPQPPSTVRLQLYSHDPASGQPAASTGLIMNLSGLTNPIKLKPFHLVKWTPATPFNLSADTCYWAVLSVDGGAVAGWIHSGKIPTGEAGALGFTRSVNSGATWVTPDNSANYKMLIRGTAIPAPPVPSVTVVLISGTELRFTFPASAGQTYALESQADLAAGEWVIVPGSTQVGTGAALEVSLRIPGDQPQQFYRVRQLP